MSTAMRAPCSRSTPTSSAYHVTGAPGGSEPASTIQSADAARRSSDSVSAPSTAGVTVGPGLFSLVVVPSGSLMVMLTRSVPVVGTGRQSMPAARSSSTNGSSAGAGSTAIDGIPADTEAREMLTPLPPACDVTDSARCTAPRSSRPARATVRSWLGLGVRVTIMRRRPPGLPG